MNVWLWGPHLWPIVHMGAYKADHVAGIYEPYRELVSSLKLALPCKYCKDSYNVFYDELGPPVPGRAFEWSYRLHQKVNSKLENQRLDKVRASECVSPEVRNDPVLWTVLKQETCRGLLFNEPSFEVLTKRAIVAGDNIWTDRDVLTVCLVLALHAQGPDQLGVGRKVPPDRVVLDVPVVQSHAVFMNALLKMYEALDGPLAIRKILKRSLAVETISQRVTILARELYPGHSDTDIDERIRLFRAGACLNGTCV